MNNKEKNITPEQCKSARGLLNWSQDDLAKKVRIGKNSISDFEKGARIPQPKNLEDIRKVFEEVGIEFENNERALGVKLLKITV